MVVSIAALWLVVIALCFVVAALARQIGVLHERIAPAGALMTQGGPRVGEITTPIAVETIDGRPMSIGDPSEALRSTLVFFLSPNCPVCKTLIPVLRSAKHSEQDWLDIVLASDGDASTQQKFIDQQKLSDFDYVLSEALGLSYQVSKLPFAIVIDEKGVLRSKGLVNSREHLESLFEAKERGVASVQEFLAQR